MWSLYRQQTDHNWMWQCIMRFFWDRHCNNTANVRVTSHWGASVQPLLQWKSNRYYVPWVCVCSLKYATCNAHAPYSDLWPALLYNIFPNYLVNGTIFDKKKILNIKCVFFIFSTKFSETFLILKTTERHTIKNVNCFSCEARYSCQVVMKRMFNDSFFAKYSNIKFRENPLSRSRVVPCGKTGTTKANSRFSQFYESA
jgi:hypothetical protein